ncbi:MAG: dienelactone hydrolase family protein [Pseudomonadota bacterium]
MSIRTRLIEYNDNGTLLEGFFACPDDASNLPCVLISHAWGGRDEFVCDKAKQLAALGYCAFALDMYGQGVFGHSKDENGALMMPFMEDRPLLQSRIGCALDVVQTLDEVDQNNIAAMGYCFGGLCVLDLARTRSDIKSVISFHGLLIPPGNTHENTVSASVLVLHGHDDPMVPPNQVLDLQTELSSAGADWQVHTYGGAVHAFTNPAADDPGFGTVYNASADNRSWQALINHLESVFAA